MFRIEGLPGFPKTLLLKPCKPEAPNLNLRIGTWTLRASQGFSFSDLRLTQSLQNLSPQFPIPRNVETAWIGKTAPPGSLYVVQLEVFTAVA